MLNSYRFAGPPDTENPTTPTNLVGTAQNGTNRLEWINSDDNIGIDSYDIWRGTSSSNLIAYDSHPSISPYIDVFYVLGTRYYYEIRARDAAGNASGWSNQVNIRNFTQPIG